MVFKRMVSLTSSEGSVIPQQTDYFRITCMPYNTINSTHRMKTILIILTEYATTYHLLHLLPVRFTGNTDTV